MIANLVELDVAVQMKAKGYKLVAQFKKERAYFDPLYFKSQALLDEMRAKDLKDWELVWVKPIEEFIAEIEKDGRPITKE